MSTLIILLMMISSIFFLFLNHPLSFGLILLIQTILVSLITGMMNYNFWFSYILFLIMVGGMLILFIYMTSVASNEKFKFSSKLLMLLFLFMIMIPGIILADHFFFNYSMFTYDIISQSSWPENSKSMNKFMNKPLNYNLFMMIIYLLITLIMVVKITNFQSGPLRQKL
nr:NADH dehydrogenase subunit 6 [Tragosoma depsarium]